MTGPDNNQGSTRPISVAELLAKNGTIGAPPVSGGRRRRRRGNSDAVTVAELTGEIPIFQTDDSGELPVVDDEAESDYDSAVSDEAGYDSVTESGTNGNGSSATVVYESEPAYESSRPVTGLERAAKPLPRRGRDAPPQRSQYPRPLRQDERMQRENAATGAESMSPDPIDDGMVIVYQSGEADVAGVAIEQTEVAEPDELGVGDVSYVRDDEVSAGLLFSGDTMADEMARDSGRSAQKDLEPIAGDLSDDLVADDVDSAEALDDVDLSEAFEDYENEYDDYYEEPSRGRLILRGLVIALQSILAVAFGAGLFLAFDQLWQWNSLVAMVLAILATLGLVAGVWVVRKTEDIASTLIAVGVGLLVTFGPLALMHAG